MKKSLGIKILEAMDQGQILTNVELSKIAGWRFGGHIYMLRKYGVEFKKNKLEGYKENFKILSIPINLIYKGRNSMKLIKEKTLLDRIKYLFNY